MRKVPVTSEAQRRASAKYKATHTKQYAMNLSIQYDADIIAQLDAVESKQTYIKALIRADIAANGPARKA